MVYKMSKDEKQIFYFKTEYRTNLQELIENLERYAAGVEFLENALWTNGVYDIAKKVENVKEEIKKLHKELDNV